MDNFSLVRQNHHHNHPKIHKYILYGKNNKMSNKKVIGVINASYFFLFFTSPSHLKLSLTHLKLLHANWLGEQVGYLSEQNFPSSEPSAQSLSKSHFQTLLIQRPLAHWNWSSEQGAGDGQL